MPSLLWETPADEKNADLSPDGKWIAYGSDRTGRFEVWVQPFPVVADEGRQVSFDGGRWPLWNPADGHELFYATPEGMMAVAVETEPTFQRGQTVRLFSTAEYGPPSGNRRIDISPDGTRFLMFKAAPATEAPRPILVQNFFAELPAECDYQGQAPHMKHKRDCEPCTGRAPAARR